MGHGFNSQLLNILNDQRLIWMVQGHKANLWIHEYPDHRVWIIASIHRPEQNMNTIWLFNIAMENP